MKSKIKIKNFYYGLLLIYIMNEVFSETQLINISAMASILAIIRYSILAVLIISIFLKNVGIGKNIFFPFFIMCLFLVFNLFFMGSGISFIPIILFTIVLKDYSLQKIFKWSLYALIFSHLFIIACTYLGILNDNIETRYLSSDSSGIFSGMYYRHDMGFLIHNQIPLFFLIIYFYIIAYKRSNITIVENIIYMIFNCFIFKMCGARVVFILVFITYIGFYFIKLSKNIRMRNTTIPWHLIYPVLTAASFIVFLGYNSRSKFWNFLNAIFNNRIKFANEAINNYGISFFGAGKNLTGNTVGNGYISITLINGIIVFIIVIGIWTYLTYLAEKKNNRYLILVLFMLAIENLINTHLGSFKLIPFFCILTNIKDPFLSEKFNGYLLLKKKRKYEKYWLTSQSRKEL